MATQVQNFSGIQLQETGAHRYRFKLEAAIRLHQNNPLKTDAEIARQVDLSLSEYLNLKKSKLYFQLETQLMTGVIIGKDADLINSDQFQDMTLQQAVPIALQTLIDCAIQKGDLRIRLSAATEILDRCGRFGKTSRIAVQDEKVIRVIDERDNETANKLVEALKQARLAMVDIKMPSTNKVEILVEQENNNNNNHFKLVGGSLVDTRIDFPSGLNNGNTEEKTIQ